MDAKVLSETEQILQNWNLVNRNVISVLRTLSEKNTSRNEAEAVLVSINRVAVEHRYNAKSTAESSKQMGCHSTTCFTEYLDTHINKKDKKKKRLLLYFLPV